MQLDFTAAQPDRVLEPAPRGGEGLAHGDGHISVMLMVDGDLAAGHLQINAHHELAALLGVGPPARPRRARTVCSRAGECDRFRSVI